MEISSAGSSIATQPRRSLSEYTETVKDTVARLKSDTQYFGDTVEAGKALPRQDSDILSKGLAEALAKNRAMMSGEPAPDAGSRPGSILNVKV